jgi:hypothetical protein
LISMIGIQRREAPGGAAHVIVETTPSKTASKKLTPIFFEDKTKNSTSYGERIERY